MQLTGDDLLREVEGVRPRDERQQPALVHAVVEEHLLLVGRRRLELAAAHGVAGGDGQRDLRRVDPGAADADAPLHEGAEHREEALVGVVDRREVAALGGDLRELVEQRGARHPHPVEPDAPVVDAVEAHLGSAVLDAYAVDDLPAGADRDDEGVHAVPLAVDLELGEHRGELGVGGGVADVVLAARVVGSRDDELLGRGVVRRDGAEGLHVGAVAALGHREAAHRATGHEVGEVRVVVGLRAELEDRAAEEAELHADLHQHRQVAHGEGLEGGDRGADVAAAAVLLGEAHPGLAGPGHHHHDVLDALAEVGGRHLLLVDEDLRVLGEVGAHQVAHLGVAGRRGASGGRRRRPRAGGSPCRRRGPRRSSPRTPAGSGTRRGHLVRDGRDLLGGLLG